MTLFRVLLAGLALLMLLSLAPPTMAGSPCDGINVSYTSTADRWIEVWWTQGYQPVFTWDGTTPGKYVASRYQAVNTTYGWWCAWASNDPDPICTWQP